MGVGLARSIPSVSGAWQCAFFGVHMWHIVVTHLWSRSRLQITDWALVSVGSDAASSWLGPRARFHRHPSGGAKIVNCSSCRKVFFTSVPKKERLEEEQLLNPQMLGRQRQHRAGLRAFVMLFDIACLLCFGPFSTWI